MIKIIVCVVLQYQVSVIALYDVFLTISFSLHNVSRDSLCVFRCRPTQCDDPIMGCDGVRCAK